MSNTFRKPYRGSRAFDASCRCHGGCPWCEGNRRYSVNKRKLSADEQRRQYELRNEMMEFEIDFFVDSLT